MLYADSMAFFAKQAEPPVFDPRQPPELAFAHLTSAPPFPMSIEESYNRHVEFARDCLANRDVRPIKWRGDMAVSDQIGCVFGMQHTPPGMTSEWMRKFALAGVRFMALAYKGPTEYGNGFLVDGPLTDPGRRAIESMAACGITLDVSHLSNQTAIEALQFVKDERLPMKPCASHSGCRSVYAHPRNVSDEVLYLLDDLDGYIGIPTISFFIVPKEELANFYKQFAEQVWHAVKICDADRVGIGSDGIHADMTLADAEANFKRLTGALETGGRFGEYHPDREPRLIAAGGAMFDTLERCLRKEDFADEYVRKVCGWNFVHYLMRALPA